MINNYEDKFKKSCLMILELKEYIQDNFNTSVGRQKNILSLFYSKLSDMVEELDIIIDDKIHHEIENYLIEKNRKENEEKEKEKEKERIKSKLIPNKIYFRETPLIDDGFKGIYIEKKLKDLIVERYKIQYKNQVITINKSESKFFELLKDLIPYDYEYSPNFNALQLIYRHIYEDKSIDLWFGE
jgi:hypothetical protein